MKVELNVDEEQFKELLEKEFKDLPKEKIQNILVESIKTYLNPDDLIDNQSNVVLGQTYRKEHPLNKLLMQSTTYHYNSTTVEPSNLLRTLLLQCDFSALQEVVDKMIEDLKENYHSILVELLSCYMAKGITENTTFRFEMEQIIQDEFYKRDQRNNDN